MVNLRERRGGKEKRGGSFARSPKQEKETAARLGGALVKGSGAGFHKGDVITERALIELKTTGKKSFAVTRELVEKIEDEALGAGGRIPVIEIEFNDGLKPVSRVAIIPSWALDILLADKGE